MGAIGLVLHPARPAARKLTLQAIEWAESHHHTVRLGADAAAELGRPDLASPDADFADGLDLAVCFGGDGTMLRTVDLVAAAGVPVLGVNVGQLGYLSAIEPEGLAEALRAFFEGRFLIEERMMVATRVELVDGRLEVDATESLNEIVIEKTPMGHTVRLSVSLDGEFFTTYAADGLIVATPTGSTAYSFSARGPIVAPGHRALIMTPVSPHMLFDRALVLEPTTEVRVTVLGPRPATLSADGRTIATLGDGDSVVCTGAEHRARLVRFDGSDFHRVLKSKFGLNDR